jgi:anti-sigma regulatory factor (Ser/Thr protein kinase)
MSSQATDVAIAVNAAPGHHNLSIYDDDGDLSDRSGPFLESGVEAGDAVIAVVDQRKWALLRELLGPACEPISYVDRDAFYTRPEDALFAYDARVRHLVAAGAPSVRVWAEFPVFTSPEQADAWIAYEAILNHAFAHDPVQIICGYDAREHSDAVLDGAAHTHPQMLGDAWSDNPQYHDPAQVVRALTPDPAALPALRRLAVPTDGTALRRTLLREMEVDGVPALEAENLLVAASEILANADRHGNGVSGLRVGRVEGRFVLELADHGAGIQDPLTGYLPPRAGHGAGAGVWVARQLTSRLEFVSSPDGFATRLWV